MNSKTSFFSKQIFKTDIKRFWWIGISYLLLFLISGVLILLKHKSFDGFYVMSVISGLLAIVLPTITFSYLDYPGSATCIHALPITRKEHFFTHLIFDFLSLCIPALICYIFAFINKSDIQAYGREISIPQTLIINIMFIIMGLSVGSCGCMISGNPLSSLVFSGLIAGAPFYTEAIIRGLLNLNVYGISDIISDFWLTNFRCDKISAYTVVIFAITLVALIISWFLYKNRAIEKNGDIIVFDWLKPVFVAMVALLLGFLGYFYIDGVLNIKSIFTMIPFGIIGIITANMLAKRAFTLKGIVKPCLIYSLFVVLLFATFKFDIFRYERHLPNIDDVVSVSLVTNPDEERWFWIDDQRYTYSDKSDPSELEFTKKEDIQNVINLHKFCFRHKLNGGSAYYPITYKLKNGRELKRYYPVNLEEYKNVLKPVLETPQMRKNKYFFLRDCEYEILSINLSDFRTSEYNGSPQKAFDTNSAIKDQATIKSLMDAIILDTKNANYEAVFNYNNTATMIELEISRPAVNIEDSTLTNKINDYIPVGVPYSYTNTIEWLKNYGFYDKLATPDEVGYIEVDSSEKDKFTVKDANEVRALYDYVCYAKNSDIVKKLPLPSSYTNYQFYTSDKKLLFRTGK